MNLYQHAKNEAISSICSDEMLDLKILQPDWLRVFRPTHQEKDLSGNTANNKIFYYLTNSANINDQIFL